MKPVIDQTNDPGYSILRALGERYPQMKELAKTASLDPAEWANLPDSAFAWSARRQFPIHNKEHALLSCGYRKIAASVPAEVDRSLEKAAEAYSLDMKIFEIPQVSEKLASEEFWLIPDKKRFRISSKEDVKVAESLLLEKYAQLDVEDRATAFHNLGWIARQLNVPLNPSTEKQAGFTITSTRILKDWINARKEASFGKAASVAFEKIAKEYENAPEYIVDRLHQSKLAELIHGLDKEAGLTGYYGKKLPDPIQTVFNTSKKRADMIKVGSILEDKSKLEALPLSFWEDVLGPDVAKEIAPGGVVDPGLLEQVISTLPQDIKIIVQKQLAGI